MLCKNCGNPLDEGTKFCSVCGTGVEEAVNMDIPDDMPVKQSDPGMVFGIIGMIAAILGILASASCCCCSCIIPATGLFSIITAVVGIILSIAGIVFSIIGMKKSSSVGCKNVIAIIGLIVSIFGIVFSVLSMIFPIFSLVGNLIVGMLSSVPPALSDSYYYY